MIVRGLDYSITKRNLQDGGSVQKTIDKEVLSRSEPYIPRSTGRTIESGKRSTKLGSGKIIYDTPYAKDIYYNNKSFSGAPQRGNYWLERMKADDKEFILKASAKESGGRAGK